MQVSSNTQVNMTLEKPVDYMSVTEGQITLQTGNDNVTFNFNTQDDVEKFFNFMLAAIRRIELKKASGETDSRVYVYNSDVTGYSELYDFIRKEVRDAV